MGLDRPITIRIMGEVTRNDRGRAVPGEVTEIPGVWASRLDAVSDRNLTPEGTLNDGKASWRIRWRSDVIAAARKLALNHEVVADGSTWTITDARESDGTVSNLQSFGRAFSARNRWIDIIATEQQG